MSRLPRTDTLATVVFLHLIIFVLRGFYLLYGPTDLYIEEAQYWLWSKQLALSYYSKPPLIAYINFLFTQIFGSTEFAVKLPALFFGFLFSLLTYSFSLELFKDRKQAVLASFLTYALPFNHIIFNIFLTDTPLLLAWAGATLFFWRAMETNKIQEWIGLGLSLGLGFLSKYTMVLFGPVMLIYVLCFKKEVLLNKKLYGSLLLGCLFAMPVLYWNYEIDFISLKHVTSIGKKAWTLGKSLSFLGEYLGGQVGFLSPFLFPFLVLSLIDAFKSKDKKLIYLLTGPLFVFVFFTIYSFTRRIEVNWPVFGYFTIPLLISHYICHSQKKRIFSVAFTITILLIIPSFYLTPYLQEVGLGKVLPPKKDPAARMIGWNKLGLVVQENIDLLPDKNYFVFSDSYHVASEVAFYTNEQRMPYNINLGRRSNQFDLWPGIEQYEGSKAYGIYVTSDIKVPEAVKLGFGELIRTDTCRIELGGVTIRKFIIASFSELNHIEEKVTKSY